MRGGGERRKGKVHSYGFKRRKRPNPIIVSLNNSKSKYLSPSAVWFSRDSILVVNVGAEG